MKEIESYRVKHIKKDEYFIIQFYVTSIFSVCFTKDKNEATIFQDGDEISKMRMNEFSFLLHHAGLKKDKDFIVECFYHPKIEQSLFTEEQMKNGVDFLKDLGMKSFD